MDRSFCFKLGISIPSLKTCILGGRSHCTEKISGDSIYFCGHPSQARNHYDTSKSQYWPQIVPSASENFHKLPLNFLRCFFPKNPRKHKISNKIKFVSSHSISLSLSLYTIFTQMPCFSFEFLFLFILFFSLNIFFTQTQLFIAQKIKIQRKGP